MSEQKIYSGILTNLGLRPPKVIDVSEARVATDERIAAVPVLKEKIGGFLRERGVVLQGVNVVGSVAEGAAQKSSDLDLELVFGENTANWQKAHRELESLKDYLSRAGLPFEVQVWASKYPGEALGHLVNTTIQKRQEDKLRGR